MNTGSEYVLVGGRGGTCQDSREVRPELVHSSLNTWELVGPLGEVPRGSGEAGGPLALCRDGEVCRIAIVGGIGRVD